MKKMIVIGNADSYWVKYYIEHIALPLQFDVSIQVAPDKNCKYMDFYRLNNVHVVGEYNLNGFIMKVPKVRALYMLNRRKVAIKEKYDIALVISAIAENIKVAKSVIAPNGKVVVLVIGSDVLRASKHQLHRLDNLLFDINAEMVCSAREPWNKIKKNFTKAVCSVDNVIGFGLTNLDSIDKLINKGPEECKKLLGIDPQKFTVCVGYNARPEQQHEKIIQELSKIDEPIKEHLHLILPMTYLGDNKYCNKIEQLLRDKQLSYSILKDFRDSEGMGILWVACDSFINGQTTDAMSASVIECIYAGVTVLSGNWLRYQELENRKIQVVTFSDFRELPAMIAPIIKNKNVRNRVYANELYESSSMHICRQKWKKFFDIIEKRK